jgi:hypothetical protein
MRIFVASMKKLLQSGVWYNRMRVDLSTESKEQGDLVELRSLGISFPFDEVYRRIPL